MVTRRSWLIWLVCAVLFFQCLPASADLPQTDVIHLLGYDEYVEKSLKEWNIPGAAVAVVSNGKVLYARGFGTRTVGTAEPVDENTLFAIGSCTKAFTSTLIAMLVDEKKLHWDDHVIDYLPPFRLVDSWVTANMTIRDLLSMRSGLENADATVSFSGFDRSEIMSRLRFLKFADPFRTSFNYMNLMYLAAGEVIRVVAEKPWSELVLERILVPVKMHDTNTSSKDLAGKPNVASPHHKHEGKMVQVRYLNADAVAEAGSINSNVTDMSKWLLFQLNDGMVGDNRLVSSAALEETHTGQNLIRGKSQFGIYEVGEPKPRMVAYGMGWGVSEYGGKGALFHAGGIDGMSALVGLVPEDKFGVVVLTNSDYGHGKLAEALLFNLFDRHFKRPYVDWSSKLLALQEEEDKKHAEDAKKLAESRVPNTRPTLPLSAYAGTYRHDLYGDWKVKVQGEGLSFAGGGPGSYANGRHWHYDTFVLHYTDPMYADDEDLVTFTINDSGRVSGLGNPDFGLFRKIE